MSKIYDALQRLEWERAEDRARKQEISGGPWKGTLVGCVLGLGVGIIVSASMSNPHPPTLPPAPPVAVLALPSPLPPVATSAVVVEEAPAESKQVAATPDGGPVAIQVGTFRNPENSARLAARLRAEGYRVTIEPSRTDDRLLVVRVGDYPDRDTAESARAALGRLGVSGLLVGARPE